MIIQIFTWQSIIYFAKHIHLLSIVHKNNQNDISMINIIVSICALLGAFLSLFLAFLLFRIDSPTRKANRILAFLLADLALIMIYIALVSSALVYGSFSYLSTPSYYIAGPCLYFYARQYLHPLSRFSLKDAMHALPSLFVFLYYLPVTINNDWFTSVIPREFHLKMMLFFWCSIVLHFFVYLRISIHTINKFCISRQKSGDGAEPTVKWLLFLYRFFHIISVMMVLSAVYDMFCVVSGFPRILSTEIILAIFAFFLICSISYRGLSDPLVFFGNPGSREDRSLRTPLSPQRIKEIMDTVHSLMLNKRLYLSPELSLPDLAAIAEVPRSDLSSAINTHTGQNFYDYINSYRVSNFIAILEQANEDMTILEMAYKSGFNSKSTFNEMFKRTTGLTPSQYRKSHSR